MTAVETMPDVAVAAARPLFLPESRMPAQSGHIPSLDGLRAVSIMIVLLSHFVNANLFPGGLGVYVFFVISGFLITRLLFGERKKSGRISLANFYFRRALRLYPVVLVFTGAVLAAMLVRHHSFDVREPLSALFYFANYLYWDGTPRTAPFSIFWSLSIEEHFYFLLPTLVLLLGADPRRVLVAMLSVCVASLALRLTVAAAHPELLTTHFFYYRTEFRLDSLAFGVALAALCEMEFGRRLILRLARPEIFCASLLIILVCLLYRNGYFRETVRYTLLGISITLAISYILFRRTIVADILNSAVFVWVGLLSYSLYIWHFVAPQILAFLLPDLPRWHAAGALLVISFITAAMSYYFLERPLLRLRAKLGSLNREEAEDRTERPVLSRVASR
jgi:peptidoglycan/LPS O-acetylase OafA/YrhL